MVMQIQKNYLKKQRNKKGNLDLKPEEQISVIQTVKRFLNLRGKFQFFQKLFFFQKLLLLEDKHKAKYGKGRPSDSKY